MAKKKAKHGGGVFLLVVILGLAAAGGGYNYHRNMGLEAQDGKSRPFDSYTDEALVELAEAYAEEGELLERKYKVSLSTRNGVRDTGGLIAENVNEFERVQKIGDGIRAATSKVADSEARLRQINDEQSWRRDESGWSLHLTRLTSI
ncbi:MAG: hypothetical protein ACI8W3_001802 [Myxococcota bacterium]|jgi:hypothetical protein